MDICRICLTSDIDKEYNNISELYTNEDGQIRNYLYIISFCLDIQVIEDSKITNKLCYECYKKILSFFEFKTLALRNDSYLKTNPLELDVKNEVFLKDVKPEVKSPSDSDDDNKNDVYNNLQDFASDDEVLSVIKNIKYEYEPEEPKENYSSKSKKKKYKKSKARKNPLVCNVCGKTVLNLKAHMVKHQPDEDRKKYKCKLCDKEFATPSSRCVHYKTKHLGIKKKCNICNKSVTNIKQHQLLIHNTGNLPYKCVSCDRKFVCQSALNKHVAMHTKDRPYICDHCDKSFRTRIVLLQHIRQVHDKEKTHLCQFCSKCFFKKYHLQIHLRSHTKEKPYECTVCGKSFASTSILNNHKLTHSNKKLFACTLCDMTFCRLGYLKAHMLSHTKVKRHPCKYCGVKFIRSDHRKRHEYTSHERHLITGGTDDNGTPSKITRKQSKAIAV